ncbi:MULTISPECIES: replication-associated recombination protein A [Dermacoccus]|uniref:Replication-associated recombination protein A n=2 Tax=Dermacoccus TaxID=57495 RepID=A0A417Z1U8_9MICO|nr:replication-associated recombination protein A [Dermacoccus abyssi]RHW43992.1 replication-associated recombination protein A [Dermacoccus abyssi]
MTADDALFAVPTSESSSEDDGQASGPLAVRMRPRCLDEIVGQGHLLRPGAPLRQIVDGQSGSSLLLYGPPGTGKTTIARLLAQAGSRHFVPLSALTSGVKELRDVIDGARRRRKGAGRQTALFIDEVHRFSKTQQDALLNAVEDQVVLLVAATTENPSFSVVTPLLSRVLVLQLQPLADEEVGILLRRAVSDERGLGGTVTLTAAAEAALVRLAGGDARSALTRLESSANTAASSGNAEIDVATVELALAESTVRYDRQGDQHYDVASAYIKSIRGSDPDAALHYLARMLVAGEDPRFVARRLLVHASEDIGLADPSALQAAVAAAHVVQLVGMPEARLALAQATVHLALAPKSSTMVAAIDEAMADVRAGGVGVVPEHLRQGRYAGAGELGHGVGYRYPHRAAEGVLAQQYPPDPLIGKDYYRPTRRGAERALQGRLTNLRKLVRGS